MKIKLIFVLAILVAVGCRQMASTSSSDGSGDVVSDKQGDRNRVEPKPTEAQTRREWQGRVGHNDFSWDGKDLSIGFPSKKKLKLFSALARSDLKFQQKENGVAECLVTYYYRPLAIAGDVISVETEVGTLCGTINTNTWSYGTFLLTDDGKFLYFGSDASKPQEATEPTDISLSDMFSEDAFFKALSANERISEDIESLLARKKIDKKPDNLAQLLDLFDRFEYDFLDGKFYVDSKLLGGFAIHHLEDDKVCVWVSLLPRVRANQALREHLELFFPLTESLRESLSRANSGEEGFLMKNAEKYVGTVPAQFEFGPTHGR